MAPWVGSNIKAVCLLILSRLVAQNVSDFIRVSLGLHFCRKTVKVAAEDGTINAFVQMER